MSKQAQREYKEALVAQGQQNDARQIRTKVQAAREGDRHQAGRRWPFELLQNAHDPGVREDRDRVDVRFSWDGSALCVAHNGKVFSSQELVALLSGGSSKDFDDESTTGRFGTGFLVTHALSTEVDIVGFLSTGAGTEEFNIELRRAGDDDDIVANIKAAEEALANAEVTSSLSNRPTVKLTYQGADPEVVKWGLERLELALPYLYATCENLGDVTVECPEGSKTYQPGEQLERREKAVFTEQEVFVRDVKEPRELTAIRVAASATARASVLILMQDGTLVRPPSSFPRVFVQFPIAGTQFLPFEVIIDGRFTPQQERDGLLMNERDRALLEEALSVMPKLALRAVKESWGGGHRLAYLAAPDRTFATEAESAEKEKKWWRATVKHVADGVARKPVIRTTRGWLPAVSSEGQTACFAIPSYDADAGVSLDLKDVHALATSVEGLNPVVLDLAEEWYGVAAQWQKLGIPVERLGLAELAAWTKDGTRSLDNLPVASNPVSWIADFVNVAAELPNDVNVQPLFAGLLPDQSGLLKAGTDLCFDEGVTEGMKEIAASLGLHLRHELLSLELVEAAQAKPGASGLLRKLVPTRTNETDEIQRLLSKLKKQLPDEKEVVEGDTPALRASAALAAHLFDSGSVERLIECPLATRDGKITYVKKGAPLLAPILSWPKCQRPYAALYPESRLLADAYAEDPKYRTALTPLIEAGFVLPGILHEGVRTAALEERLLKRVATDGTDVEGVTLRGEAFSQIAVLTQVVIPRCRGDESLAKLLLKFVLCVAAEQDSAWRETREAWGTRGGERLPVRVCAAIWPAELSVRQWIPIKGEEDVIHVPGTAAHLQPLVEAEWLRDHPAAVELLSQEFGFTRLDLLLEAMDPEESRLLGDNLAALTQKGASLVAKLAQADAETLEEVAAQVDLKQKQAKIKDRNKQFGLAIQKAIAQALEEKGLSTELVDYGFDYEVSASSGSETDAASALEAASFEFEVGSHLLEVKATTTGEVRLTPLQARNAAKNERFVLCVVDLRHVACENLIGPWSPEDVTPYAHFLDVSEAVEDVYDFVEVYSEEGGGEARLRNEGQLRYGISPQIWEAGISLAEWVATLNMQEKSAASPAA